VLSYIIELREYTLKNWGMSMSWCIELINYYVTTHLKEKFWLSLTGKV